MKGVKQTKKWSRKRTAGISGEELGSALGITPQAANEMKRKGAGNDAKALDVLVKQKHENLALRNKKLELETQKALIEIESLKGNYIPRAQVDADAARLASAIVSALVAKFVEQIPILNSGLPAEAQRANNLEAVKEIVETVKEWAEGNGTGRIVAAIDPETFREVIRVESEKQQTKENTHEDTE